MEKKEITIDSVLDLLEKPILIYVQNLMARAGMTITEEEAANMVSNVGMRILKRKMEKL